MGQNCMNIKQLRSHLLDRRSNLLAELRNGNGLRSDTARNPADSAELAADSFDQDMAAYVTNMKSREIIEIDSTLDKIDHENYGVCMECRQPIALERLKVVPTATLCVECQEKSETARKPANNGLAWGRVGDTELEWLFEC